MKINNKQLVELFGVLTVVLSLLFLAYEVNQSNRIAIASMEYEIRNNFTTLNELGMTDTAWAELYVNMKDPDYQLTAVDRFKISKFMARLTNIWYATTEAYNNDLVSEATFNGYVRDDIRSTVFSRPVMHDYWYEYMAEYPSAENTAPFRYLRQYLEEYKSLRMAED